MDTSVDGRTIGATDAARGEKWFVEEFHLRSPVEEFQESSRLEIERLRRADPKFDDSIHRGAVDLVLRKLPGEKAGGTR